MKIVCKPCFIIDTVVALARNKYCRDDIPEMQECIFKATDGLEIVNSDWSFNDALFQKMNWSIPEIEKMTLEDLRAVLPDAMIVNDFILPCKEHVEIALDRLIESDYINLWHELCLPLLNKHCTEIMNILKNINTDALINDINVTKKEKIKVGAENNIVQPHLAVMLEDNVINYVSYFMEGGIGLMSGVSVTSRSYGGKEFVTLWLHELLHGFINDEVTELYKYICENDGFQKKTRWYLTNRWGSGGWEEEFVIAIEHYISVKNGIETLEKSQERLNNVNDKSVPIAIIIFHELIKESAVPENYNAWLVEKLKAIIEYGNIQKQVDEIFSDYSSSFLNCLSDYEKSKLAE